MYVTCTIIQAQSQRSRLQGQHICHLCVASGLTTQRKKKERKFKFDIRVIHRQCILRYHIEINDQRSVKVTTVLSRIYTKATCSRQQVARISNVLPLPETCCLYLGNIITVHLCLTVDLQPFVSSNRWATNWVRECLLVTFATNHTFDRLSPSVRVHIYPWND